MKTNEGPAKSSNFEAVFPLLARSVYLAVLGSQLLCTGCASFPVSSSEMLRKADSIRYQLKGKESYGEIWTQLAQSRQVSEYSKEQNRSSFEGYLRDIDDRASRQPTIEQASRLIHFRVETWMTNSLLLELWIECLVLFDQNDQLIDVVTTQKLYGP